MNTNSGYYNKPADIALWHGNPNDNLVDIFEVIGFTRDAIQGGYGYETDLTTYSGVANSKTLKYNHYYTRHDGYLTNIINPHNRIETWQALQDYVFQLTGKYIT